MKKKVFLLVAKIIVFCGAFVAALIMISRIMNKDNIDMTGEMQSATFPVLYMGIGEMRYNELHGFSKEQDTRYQRDTITILDEDRSLRYSMNTYGESIGEFAYELRNVDGSRLIENGKIEDYTKQGNILSGTVVLKDLIEENEEYELIFLVTLPRETVRYYTRILWVDNYFAEEKLQFVKEFQDTTFDRENADKLSKYMESNSRADNTTFHYVDIHCSLKQVTWGELQVSRVTEPVFNLREIDKNTACITSHYVASAPNGDDTMFFYVEEFYRIRYTAERTYLLDYTRTAETMMKSTAGIFINDKIIVGVGDPEIEITETENGSVFAFVQQNKLFSYNATNNKATVVFSFYGNEFTDERTMFDEHKVKVLRVDEDGNVIFLVAGYMNRGLHEGEVGTLVYAYDAATNVNEELLYIPYDKTAEMLLNETERLTYLNEDGYLYLMQGDHVVEINLAECEGTVIAATKYDESIMISEDSQILAWQSGDLYHSENLELMDLNTRERITVYAGNDRYIMPLGFMDQDLLYGVANKSDVTVDAAGRTFFPMCEIDIRSSEDGLLKTYGVENYYTTAITITGNRITLERVMKTESGMFMPTTNEQIMNNEEPVEGYNRVTTVTTENYGTFVQVAMKKEINARTLQLLVPKELLYENGNVLQPESSVGDRYYVYAKGGLSAVYREPANAIALAESQAGTVLDDTGVYIWKRTTRVSKNQIMAIGAESITEEKDSLAVCLDTILKFEGVVRNSEYLLAQGETPYSVLENNLEGARILNLEGCSLDAILYYVNMDIPVMTTLSDGTAMLIIGFNDYNIVLMDPIKGSIYKKGINDSKQWLTENGNCFLTYIR